LTIVVAAEDDLAQSAPVQPDSFKPVRPVFNARFLRENRAQSFIGQQVSVAAANAIYGRFAERTELDPARGVALELDDIKAIGLSKQKAGYLHDLAEHFVDNPAVYNHLDTQTDEQVIEELTAVKGIGVWTAQMFLMFTLARPDVFAPDDGGLQRGMMKLYGWTELPPKKELAMRAEAWRPYRTVASLHLWQSLDNTSQ